MNFVVHQSASVRFSPVKFTIDDENMSYEIFVTSAFDHKIEFYERGNILMLEITHEKLLFHRKTVHVQLHNLTQNFPLAILFLSIRFQAIDLFHVLSFARLKTLDRRQFFEVKHVW